MDLYIQAQANMSRTQEHASTLHYCTIYVLVTSMSNKLSQICILHGRCTESNALAWVYHLVLIWSKKMFEQNLAALSSSALAKNNGLVDLAGYLDIK
jgi:acetyl-CoA carboxylase carboxyltransferase component